MLQISLVPQPDTVCDSCRHVGTPGFSGMTNSCLKQGGFKPPFPICWEPRQAPMAWETDHGEEGKQMKLNDLVVISDAVERISKATGTNAQVIIDALVGTAWDEEDAGRIKESLL
jgi:hypothetical protein